MEFHGLDDQGQGACSVPALQKIINPFALSPWEDVQPALLEQEVRVAIACNALVPPGAELVAREDHAGRIAWFVIHGWDDPVDLDVGIPELGYFGPGWLDDGNHRLAAAIMRGDKTIKTSFSGSISYAQDLGILPSKENHDGT